MPSQRKWIVAETRNFSVKSNYIVPFMFIDKVCTYVLSVKNSFLHLQSHCRRAYGSSINTFWCLARMKTTRTSTSHCLVAASRHDGRNRAKGAEDAATAANQRKCEWCLQPLKRILHCTHPELAHLSSLSSSVLQSLQPCHYHTTTLSYPL